MKLSDYFERTTLPGNTSFNIWNCTINNKIIYIFDDEINCIDSIDNILCTAFYHRNADGDMLNYNVEELNAFEYLEEDGIKHYPFISSSLVLNIIERFLNEDQINKKEFPCKLCKRMNDVGVSMCWFCGNNP
jgi:hypothetical protein